ncbi:ATP synthase subunit f, mitochondrial [Neolecta irregularis DAH-3]|uniref:ATP synthase subunit f, mitochondrial n=1 Tax=Neolecta irregularis (strain DAH-3) TaxID=1198029 RepID=A0A1U7LKJ3_NEOID|nr:ATP synthase subunit f, mitochondrial [Neolecta irregularis DAH-3]|eukprot:OLL23062.1 ATP synthase subunit f, mitochondrial [Neolecta irregularis DAH-3]
MSFIVRRALSTSIVIPPKIASPAAIGAPKDAARMARIVDFYSKLPRGPKQDVQSLGLIGRYKQKYFDGDNASGVPLLHLIGSLLVIGYSMQYYFHLRHHKNHQHH